MLTVCGTRRSNAYRACG